MRKTTAEKIQAEKDRKQQIQNAINKLQQKQRAEERTARNHRIAKRGAYVESIVEGSPEMTDEQFYSLVKTAIDLYGKAKPTKSSITAPADKADVEEDEGVAL